MKKKLVHVVMHFLRRVSVHLSQFVYLLTSCLSAQRAPCVLILMAPQSPRLARNNEDSTFNNLDRQIKKRIQ